MRLVSLIFALCLVSLGVRAEEAVTQETAPAKAAETVSSEATPISAAVSVEAPKESEIALNLDKAKKSSEGDSSVFRMIFSLGVLAVVGGGAFFWLRKYAVPKGMKHQTQIKVLQQHYLGPKKSLAIIRVAGESLLIGVTDHNISMIKSLSLLDDEVPEETPAHFAGTLNQYVVADEDAKPAAAEGEEFSFGSIKDVVAKRLKGMRSLE